jgi:hypothetical protein
VLNSYYAARFFHHFERESILSHINTIKTTMDDKLRQVQEEIAATKEKLATAERQRKEDLVVSLTNLLVGLNQKELLLLSAGEMHYNRGVCDIVLFLSI